MADANSVDRQAKGVEESGWPQPWRFVFSRHPRDFGDVVNDPARGPWNRQQPDGSTYPGHTDAYEQQVCIGEQIAWKHQFSDGVWRDTADVLMDLMEFAIQWRLLQHMPTCAFTDSTRQTDALPVDEDESGESTSTVTEQKISRTPASWSKKG